jgi:enoyl-CoA hydratase/carnithine racemase
VVSFEQIIYEKREGVATITLNRPERLNAFTRRMLDEWLEALQDADRDPDVRCVVLTGAGRGFCSGMDVRNQASGEGLRAAGASMSESRTFLRDSVHRIPRMVERLQKPYIAAVNGPAVGAGMDMASMCDIRFASRTARFGMTYVRMGLIPGDGGCFFLPRIVGVPRALDLIWTGRMFSAQEALEMGYVSAVVEESDVMSFTREYAASLGRGPSVAIYEAKRLLYQGLRLDLDPALDMAQQSMLVCQSTEDAEEGPRAFVEKREPRFVGR